MADHDLGNWYRSIPVVSKYWFTGTVVLPLICRFGILSPYWLILDFHMVFYKFQIWRPFTALFFYPISPQTGFHYLILLYFLYSYSTRLESGLYFGRSADYLFMLFFNWLCLVFIAVFSRMPMLLDPMVMSVLYVWCQINKDEIVSFWFGTIFKAMYLPWVLAAFNMILGHGGKTDLLGILVGHLYFFLMFKYPQDYGGREILRTPSIFYRFLPNQSGGVRGFGVPPSTRRNDNVEGRHQWGRGHALGGN